jgi:uncharacterized RDD family membrane protein YckC
MKDLDYRPDHSTLLNFPTRSTVAQESVSEPALEVSQERWEKAREGKLKKRFYAFFTDLFIIGLLQKFLVYSYISFVSETFIQAPFAVRQSLLGNVAQLRLSTLLFTFFSYFLVSYYMGHGKTIGKTLFNLRVLSHEGAHEELSFMESFMRTVGYTTCYATGSFLFGIVFLRNDQRGIPDFFSQTEVITEEELELILEQEKLEELALQKTDDNEGDQLDLFAA